MRHLLKPWRNPASLAFFRSDDRILMIVIGILVGMSSGVAAVALNYSLVTVLEWMHPLRHYWWAFAMPAAGAALSSIFLNKIMNEGAGHGVPEVIYSVSRYGGLMRRRSIFSRLISSCLTIGSGGSAGPEAPVVMSGAAIGSNIAQFFSLNDRQRVTLVGCGAAGAISAIFNAPIAGMVFSIEIILGEWTSLNIIPIAIASVAGTEVSRFLQGNRIPFAHRQFNIDLMDTLACIGLAVFCALASILLTRMLRKMATISKGTPLPVWVRAGLGGAIVGIIGYFMPVVLGEGYHAVHTMIEGVYREGIFIVAFAALAKIIATTFTLGWGGSGGIFAPCLVIGSFAGLAYHRALIWLWPSVSWVNEGCYALLGMAGLVSGMLQAPLTGIFLILEITGGYEVMLPLMIVSAIATTMCHSVEPASFYMKDLVEGGHLLRPGTDERVLSDLSVQELLEKDCISVKQNMLLREFIGVVKQSHRNHFPVEDEETGNFLGIVHLDDIRPYLFDSGMYDAVLVGQIMSEAVETVGPGDDLQEIISRMDAKGLFSMPVVANDRFIGMVSKATILDRYRKELMVQTHH